MNFEVQTSFLLCEVFKTKMNGGECRPSVDEYVCLLLLNTVYPSASQTLSKPLSTPSQEPKQTQRGKVNSHVNSERGVVK